MVQSVFLGIYKVMFASGLVSTSGGRALFEWLYERYKLSFEAGDIRALASFVRPGTTVVDVGANVGFFTKRFGRWVSAGGRVIAIEPDATNFSRLERMIDRHNLKAVVDPVRGAAAEAGGTLKLELNPLNPADHKLADHGIEVRAYSLDDLLIERRWPPISLVKIDVQGAEERLLRGARQTLDRFHPALFVEIHDAGLRGMKTDAETVLGMLENQGYRIHRIIKGRVSSPMTMQDAMAFCRDGRYADFLFLHPEGPQPRVNPN